MCIRSDDLQSADKAMTKRLVQRAIGNVVRSRGMGLGEVRLGFHCKLPRVWPETQTVLICSGSIQRAQMQADKVGAGAETEIVIPLKWGASAEV